MAIRTAASILLFLCSLHAHALNPAHRLADLNHASWTEKDGVPSDIRSMAQTRDGWLWLGTGDGLYRFDGVSFDRVPVRKSRILDMYAADNGDLLVSFELSGMTVIHADGSVTDIDSPEAALPPNLNSPKMDHAGDIWAATMVGVRRYRHGKWEAIPGGDWSADTRSLLFDQYGQLWAANGKTLFRYDRAQNSMVAVAEGAGFASLIQSPDGRIWAWRGDVVQPVPASSQGQRLPRAPDANASESRAFGPFDRDGNLWALAAPYGIAHVARADRMAGPIRPGRDATDRFDQEWQLSSLSVNSILEDREGNIWIATGSGLDRFRENKLLRTRMPSPTTMYSMAKDSDGRLWFAEATNGALWRTEAAGQPQRVQGPYVGAVVNDRDGALLLARKRDIERIDQGRVSHIPMPMRDGKPVDVEVIGMQDDGRVLWVVSPQFGLLGWKDGRWHARAEMNLPARIYMSAPAGHGQLWLSHADGKLDFYDNGQVTRSYEIAMVGQETGIFPGPQLVVTGERGIAVLAGERFVHLAPVNSDLRNISGLAVTPDGDRWLNSVRGVVHIRRADWEASLRQPATPLVYDVIDTLEGYSGRAATDNRSQTIINAGGGQLWLRSTSGIMRLDTTALRPNTVKPAVRLLRLSSDDRHYAITTGLLQLPPDTRSFNIQYSAPGLRKPEGMRFQYMLEGVDSRWQDAGARRAAYYTNIGPGTYTFRVRATNEDGIASDAAAAVALRIAPTVTQTWWFLLLCALAGLLLLYGLHRYRVRIATAGIARQLAVRMDERERIARTLHDTFLQGVHTLSLRVYSVLSRLPEDNEIRQRLEFIINEADRVIVEGRNQVKQLRNGLDLEQQLQQAGNALSALEQGTRFSMHTTGARRTLAPPVQDELSAIAQEAIANAFQHAAASEVSAHIAYGADDFVVRISDNGHGLDQHDLARGKGEHWGIVGMRERTRHIGAQLELNGTPGQGTSVTLTLPAALAYMPGD